MSGTWRAGRRHVDGISFERRWTRCANTTAATRRPCLGNSRQPSGKVHRRASGATIDAVLQAPGVHHGRLVVSYACNQFSGGTAIVAFALKAAIPVHILAAPGKPSKLQRLVGYAWWRYGVAGLIQQHAIRTKVKSYLE